MLKGSAFPLEAGMNRVSSGTYELVKGVRAYEESVIIVTSPNQHSFQATIAEGEDREIINAESVEVVSGLISLTRRTIA